MATKSREIPAEAGPGSIVERNQRTFQEVFECDPNPKDPANRKKVIEKLGDIAKKHEKNPTTDTAHKYHYARKLAEDAGYPDIQKSPMWAAYDAQKPEDRLPAGIPEKLQK